VAELEIRVRMPRRPGTIRVARSSVLREAERGALPHEETLGAKRLSSAAAMRCAGGSTTHSGTTRTEALVRREARSMTFGSPTRTRFASARRPSTRSDTSSSFAMILNHRFVRSCRPIQSATIATNVTGVSRNRGELSNSISLAKGARAVADFHAPQRLGPIAAAISTQWVATGSSSTAAPSAVRHLARELSPAPWIAPSLHSGIGSWSVHRDDDCMTCYSSADALSPLLASIPMVRTNHRQHSGASRSPGARFTPVNRGVDWWAGRTCISVPGTDVSLSAAERKYDHAPTLLRSACR
jgi:hypothetical protein